jgi:hypothetical protein
MTRCELETYLLIHVFSYFRRFGLSDLYSTDVQGVDDRLDFGDVCPWSGCEGEYAEIRMMSSEVGEDGRVGIRSRCLVCLIYEASAILPNT